MNQTPKLTKALLQSDNREQKRMRPRARLAAFLAFFALSAVYIILMIYTQKDLQKGLRLYPEQPDHFHEGFVNEATGEPVGGKHTLAVPRGEEVTLVKTMPEGLKDGCRLSVLTSGVRVRVYAGDKLIYASGLRDEERIGREPGRIINLIDLSEAPEGSELRLRFEAYKRRGIINVRSINAGTEAALLLHAMRMNAGVLFGCIFSGFLGLILLGYGIYFRAKGAGNSKEVLCVGFFSLLVSVFACTDSTLIQLFTDHLAIRYQLRYYMLTLLFVPFMILFKNRCRGSVRLLVAENYGLVALLFFNTGLYITGLMPLSDSISLVYGLWALLLVTCFAMLIREVRVYKNTTVIIPFVSYLFMVGSAVADFICYDAGWYDIDDLFFGVALLLFLMLFSVFSYRDNMSSLNRIQFLNYYRDLAFTDQVTGGKTRSWFVEEADRILKNNENYTVVYFDLIHFKMVNDTIGRTLGDGVLRAMYETLNGMLEKNEIICHAGDAHFLLLLAQTDKKALHERLYAMKQKLNEIPIGGMEHNRVGVIAGAYLIPEDKQSVPRMIDRAIMARNEMQIEVINGFGCGFFTEAVLDKLRREDDLKNRMLDGMKAGEFLIYLQPKVDPESGKIKGAEALARWMDPIEGIISPGEFIPIFENNGSIITMNLFMLRGTIRIINGWIKNGIQPVTVSVNLSRISIHNPLFMDEFTSIMRDPATPVSYLEFEFTENVVYESAEQMNKLVEQIHGFGSTCSIDDFGCSYSNLTMLKDIPVDVLKLDRDFLYYDGEHDLTGQNHAEMTDIVSDRSLTIVESVVTLAHELHMEVVAEGVENKEQADFLKGCGCDMIQGYYYSRPLPEEEFIKYLKARNTD